MDKRVIARVILWGLVWVALGLYIVSTFANINAVRKIHAGYIKGFMYQKECSDEYTEYESSRRLFYLSLKNGRDALDTSAYMSLLLLLWIPVVFAGLIAASRIGIPSRLAALWASSIVVFVVLYLCSHFVADSKIRARFYTFFKGTYCDAPHDLQPKRQYFHQAGLFLLTFAIVYSYFKLRVLPESESETPNSIGEALAQQLQDNSTALYGLVVLWLFTAYWVFVTVRKHADLRTKILCPYEDRMEDYKNLLMNYIYPKPDRTLYPTNEAYDREVTERFNRIKDHIERNYMRIHGSMPTPAITEDNETIVNYTDYLMHWRGREFETAPETPELNELRDFMYRLRTHSVTKNTMEGYFKFNKWYLLIQLVIVVYLVFHLLFNYTTEIGGVKNKPLEKWMTLFIAGGLIGALFLMSWYAWFDVALRI